MKNEPFKWQNILDRECPRCGLPVTIHETKKGETYFNCVSCDFGIATRHLLHMLSNPNSAINKFIRPDQKQAVVESFERAMQ